ncbi:major facilitator superfamily domain-containing protein [Lipomyces tetrasporus]|uniref:Major facilitator superfamily domain-containing protein n=1 Tax=Lipomyces tetrasporus TaxID=54092 RepID=A0AAD7VU03_9ASCO|nr:major facilitator superfamily domain-containing protein [Lipomyces tetrasporus]KAJ8102607.1 major facilitator superfamily domain-containing protein [Lipomyces tetrasporus]
MTTDAPTPPTTTKESYCSTSTSSSCATESSLEKVATKKAVFQDVERSDSVSARERLELSRIRSGAVDMDLDEQEQELQRGMSRVDSKNPDVVGWDGPNDPANPFNWPNRKKWRITLIVALVTFCVAFASSVFTAGISSIAEEFHISSTVATLGLTLYVVGFATGPLVFAPMSEVYGRNVVYIGSWIPFMLFQIGCALSKNAATLLVSRLISGIAGSSPLSNAGGTLGDIWTPAERGDAMSFFTLAPFMGPVFGPIVGGFLAEYVSWRWTFWLVLILSGVMFIFLLFAMPETYSKVLLERKAAHLRKETGNENLHAAHERGGVSHMQRFGQSIVRPVVMLVTEPIVFLISLYCALVYAILYMNFVAYPIVYQRERGWSMGIGGLPFLAIGFGMVCAVATSPYQTKLYLKLTAERGNSKIYPEGRLPFAIFGAFCLPVGIFWFGWATLPQVHWICSVLAGIPFGFGMVILFLCMFSYLVDSYLLYAASSLAANTLLRSLFGAFFPLFASRMYIKLTPRWACTLLGFISLAMAPIPFLFYKYGPAIRARSKRTF